MGSAGIPFAKGHGTGNDFVLLTHPVDGDDVSRRIVAALCDRRRGLGADGVLVVLPTEGHREVAGQASAAQWFMDYRNADGSIAAMCGNGARVFAAHLVASGLAEPGTFTIATRGGPRQVTVPPPGTVLPPGIVGPPGTVAQPGADAQPGVDAQPQEISVAMGPAVLLSHSDIEVAPADDPNRRRPAVGVLMPNPHAVVWVDDLGEAGSLLEPPAVTPKGAYPEGCNVEFVQLRGADHIALRVYERGVGETLSCGTGACAAAVATLSRAGLAPSGQEIRVDVPGGRLLVTWAADGGVRLTGPAVILAHGEISREWWDEHV